MDAISGVASIAGLISLADLIVKYSKLISVWKDAPESVRRIKTLLISLKPIIDRLEELQALSGEDLFLQGLNTVGFRADMKELRDLVEDMLDGTDRVGTWKRTKWTLRSEAQATELGKRLNEHITVFTLVMTLANEKSAADMNLHILSLLNNQPLLHASMLEVLDITRDTQQMQRAVERRHDLLEQRFATEPQPHTYKPEYRSSSLVSRSPKTVFEAHAGKAVCLKGHVPSCPFANRPLIDNTNCECIWGLGESRFRNTKTRTPHTGRQKESTYLFETEFTTWQTMFGKFRLHLSVKAQKQAWSLSFPTITFSKQNIVPDNALVFKLAEEGDIEGILELFREGLASPNDRELNGTTILHYALRENQLQMATILIDEGSDIYAESLLNDEMEDLEEFFSAGRQAITPIVMAIPSTDLGAVFSRMLENGADLYNDPIYPEILFHAALMNRAVVHILAHIAGTLIGTYNFSSKNWPRKYNPYYASLHYGSLDGFQVLISFGYQIGTLLEVEPYSSMFETPSSTRTEGISYKTSSNSQQTEWPHCIFQIPRTGWVALHVILSGDWDEDTTNSDASRFCELIAYLINSGADPKAPENGVTPTELVWKGAEEDCATVQRRVVLWYRALRSCGLDPKNYDSDYDSRFDKVSEGCHFCLRDSETNDTSEFVACPWCFGDLYNLRSDAGEWYTEHNLSERYPPARHHIGSTSSGTRTGRSMHPCCSAVCSRHIVKATKSGLLLPVNSGAQMRRYREQLDNYWYSNCYSLEWIEDETQESKDGEGTGGSEDGDDDEEGFHDALELI